MRKWLFSFQKSTALVLTHLLSSNNNPKSYKFQGDEFGSSKYTNKMISNNAMSKLSDKRYSFVGQNSVVEMHIPSGIPSIPRSVEIVGRMSTRSVDLTNIPIRDCKISNIRINYDVTEDEDSCSYGIKLNYL